MGIKIGFVLLELLLGKLSHIRTTEGPFIIYSTLFISSLELDEPNSNCGVFKDCIAFLSDRDRMLNSLSFQRKV